MTDVKTVFGSIRDYRKGHIELIADNPKNYVFSNVFEVAAKSKPYERVAVGKNFQYVIETLRAEGTSPWYTAAHDEFALVMDGAVEVQLVQLAPSQRLGDDVEGAALVNGEPQGKKMGRIQCGRGHMALLPKHAAYRFRADRPSVITIQTIHGALTIERWSDICLK